MYKKLFILVPATILLFLGFSWIVNLANSKSWYAYTAPVLVLILLFIYGKIWRRTFKSWYDWLSSTSYERNQAIKDRVKTTQAASTTIIIPKTSSDEKGS